MSFIRTHKIVSSVALVIILLLALGAVVGQKKKSGGNTAPKSGNTAPKSGSALPTNKSATDARWLGLAGCLTANGIQNGATDKALDTYALLDKNTGDAVGNVTYSDQEQYKYGPVSWTFDTNPAPPASAEAAVTTCIHETFGSRALSNRYVKRYTSPHERTDDAALRDPHWKALRTCFTDHGLSYFYESDFPTTVIVHRTGVVDYGESGPGTALGPIKYLLNTKPPPTTANRAAFMTCLNQEY